MRRHKNRSRVRELTTYTVRARPGRPRQGILSTTAVTMCCAIGTAGMAAVKHEGDGKTPLGRWKILRVLYRADRVKRPRTQLPVRPIRRSDGWCDTPNDRNYNRPVSLPYTAGAERLYREDTLYDIIVVLDYNIRPRARGRGSAIFMHVARDGLPPTEGCIALPVLDLDLFLLRCRPGSSLRVLS